MAVLTAVRPNIPPTIVAGKVTIRKSVYALTDAEVTKFRVAVAKIAAISAENPQDTRGYQYVANIHGNYCHKFKPGFALWHRPYVQLFEQILQDVDPDVFLPYWDWTTTQAQQEGLPAIFTDPTWTNPETGQDEPNPLFSQPKTLGGGGQTERGDDIGGADPGWRDLVHKALRAPDYQALTTDLENPHNSVHGWVGGDMGYQGVAAYDPVFWVHHSFVEYAFCQWQDAFPEEAPPRIDPRRFAPFGVTVEQIWDYRKLGYRYQPNNAGPLQVAGISDGPGAQTSNALQSGVPVAHFPLYSTDPDFSRGEVRFERCTPPKETFAVRIFADAGKADASTPTNDNPNYLGTWHFFGHGRCLGAEGHCEEIVDRDVFDLRVPHHYASQQVRVDVTKRLKALIANGRANGLPAADNPAGNATITLVAVDRKGNEIQDPGLHFDALSVVIR
jgi:tyrosinase